MKINFNNKKAMAFFCNHIKSNYEKIEVIPGECRYNFKCQFNAVHEAFKNNQDKIALAFFIDSGWPIIHFLNINTDGQYIDNTLGYWSQCGLDYYLVRTISKDQFYKTNDLFVGFREDFRSRLPIWLKLTSDYEC